MEQADKMERANKILKHDLFLECYHKTEEWEKTREFCHHDMVHFLDVARLATILHQRESIEVEEELVYATALLHDIGRFRQYEDGTPHELASAELAEPILVDCGFDDRERKIILEAIRQHRNRNIAGERSLNGLLYRADKLSRSCFFCKAEKQCNWKGDKKNLELRW